ncbi:MAG: hypothetical protein HGN29_13125 [Asgard group archaeon]|nr:hypothetical protein [Asgard group archaeon]
METLSGSGLIDNSESKETLKVLEKRGSVNKYKVISLIFSGLTGIFAFGIFGQFWSLADANYQALLFRINVIGYICTGFAIINIVMSLVFKENMFVFIIFSCLTAIFGSFQFIVFAISPFGVADKINRGVLGHYQYIITFVLSLITLIFVYLHIISSRKKEMREKEQM